MASRVLQSGSSGFWLAPRPTGGLTSENRTRASLLSPVFARVRVSWPVVGVRMRLARPGPVVAAPRGEGRPRAGITRLLRSADSPEEIIVATHERPACSDRCPFEHHLTDVLRFTDAPRPAPQTVRLCSFRGPDDFSSRFFQKIVFNQLQMANFDCGP